MSLLLRGMPFYATAAGMLHTFSPFPLFYAPRLSGQARVRLMSSNGNIFFLFKLASDDFAVEHPSLVGFPIMDINRVVVVVIVFSCAW